MLNVTLFEPTPELIDVLNVVNHNKFFKNVLNISTSANYSVENRAICLNFATEIVRRENKNNGWLLIH